MENREQFSYGKVIATYMAWWLVWIAVQAYILYTWQWPWPMALADSVITQLLLAMSGYVMNTMLRYYRPGQKNVMYIAVWSLVMGGIIIGLQRATLGLLFQNDNYLTFLNQSLLLRYLFDWLMIAFVSVVSWLWYFLQEQQENEKRKQDAEQLVRLAELNNLRQQLQPHFLFNSLNSISALSGSKPEEARKMVQQLSDFLRGTLKKDDRQFVSLQEELHHLQLYLDIEKVRFGHRLQTQLVQDENADTMKLPSLLLQPVVENAIKFGLYDTTGETTISILAKAEDKMLVIQVRNPFDVVTSSSRGGTGFGLSSVQRRLYLLFSRSDLLLTSQEENIFVTTIKIPQHT